ncbi:MAG: hypothetical protein PUB21_03615 [Bacteroidales bacterium]|nr:hypothetical protein [Bacteroidales bacterium]
MKKLVLFAAIAVAVSFASCGNKAETNQEVAETPATEEVTEAPVVEETTVVEETVSVDSTANNAQ